MDIKVPGGGVRKMPAVGMGTSTHPLPTEEVMVAAFLDAIEVRYCHFDTAALFGSEESVGKAVAEAVDKGLVGSRDEFFITSKAWCTDLYPELVVPALKNSFREYGMQWKSVTNKAYVKLLVLASNFGPPKLCQLLDYATIPPSVNQQKELVELCKQKGVQVCAGSSLTADGTNWGSFAVMKNPVLQEIAEAKGKSISHVSLN